MPPKDDTTTLLFRKLDDLKDLTIEKIDDLRGLTTEKIDDLRELAHETRTSVKVIEATMVDTPQLKTAIAECRANPPKYSAIPAPRKVASLKKDAALYSAIVTIGVAAGFFIRYLIN